MKKGLSDCFEGAGLTCPFSSASSRNSRTWSWLMPGLSKASSNARRFALLSPVTICAFFRNSHLLQIRPHLLSSLSELRWDNSFSRYRGDFWSFFEISSLFLMSLGEPDLIGFYTSSSLFTYERLQEKGMTEKTKLNTVDWLDFLGGIPSKFKH